MNKFQLFCISRGFYLTIVFSLIFLCLEVTSGFAQIGVKYTVLPAANMKSVDAPAGEKAEMSMGILDFNVGIPLYVDENEETGEIFSIENELEFRRQTFDMTLPTGQNEYFPTALYSINYSISGVKSLSEKWFMVGFLSTGIFTDFENVDSDHFLAEGGLIFARKFGESFTLGLGPVFTYAFGNPVLIPAPLVKYTSGNEKFSIDIKVPQHIILSYAFSENFQSKLAIGSLYSNYKLGDDRALSDGKGVTIVFSDLTIALESLVRLYGPIGLEAAIGTTVNREFTVEDHKEKELFDRGMDNTLFFSVGLKTVF
jgi:hypothetical protein